MNQPRVKFFRSFAAGLLLAAGTLAAQPVLDAGRPPAGLENDFLLRVWETLDGFSPTGVRSLTQTRDGYLWLAAQEGAVRFDGTRAVVFSSKNTPALPTPFRVSRVHADAAGRLWCATADQRLFSLDQGVWREHTEKDGWKRMTVETMASSPASGKIYFSGGTNLLEFSQGRFSLIATPELPPGFRGPFKVLFGEAGRMWLASPRFLWRRDESQWQLVYSGRNFAATIFGAAPARGPGVWIANARQLLKFGVTGTEPELVRARSAGARNDPVQMAEDARGNLWVGGIGSGLRVWMADGREGEVGTGADGLRPQITALFEDREGNVLAATASAGLARFKPRPFDVFLGSSGGLAGIAVNTLCEESPGHVLAGGESAGLRRIVPGGAAVQIVSPNNTLNSVSRVTSLLRQKDGTVIAAVFGNGLFRVEGDRAVPIPADILTGEIVRALFEDGKGRLWIGYEKGLAVRTNGVIHRFPAEGKTPLTAVRGIVEDWNGVVWFTGKEGLFRMANGKLEKVPLPDSLLKTTLVAPYADADGALWMGVDGRGLLRFKAGQAKMFTVSHGLPFLSLGAILQEGDHLWLSGEKGLVRVSRKSLNAVAEGRATRLEFQFFNRADGLSTDAFRRYSQPAGFKAADGRLWFASHKGAVAVRPKDIVNAAFEPPAIIEEMQADLKPVSLATNSSGGIEIPAGTRQISFRCAKPSLGRPESARFQYRLEGQETQWHDNGGERVIRLFDLAPGAHRLQVRTFGTDGRLVEPATTVRFQVRPFYWQNIWLRALGIGAVASVAGLVVWGALRGRLRTQAEIIRDRDARAELEGQLQQSQKVEAIGRLAGGIAHDFNNLLTVILGNTELLRMRLAGQADAEKAIGSILQAGGRARDLVSQILTFSRPQLTAPVAVDLAPALREACQLLRAGTPAMVEVKFEIPETLPPVLADPAEIQRVVLNLGTNAVQAVGSSGGRIHIQAGDFVADAQFFVAHPKLTATHLVRLTVADNGAGMDNQTMSRIFDPFFTTKGIGKGTGLGLSVVHGIVEAHRGVITVRSQPGQGTTFEAFFPVTTAMVETKTEQFQPLPKGHGENILLVDDDPAVLPLTRMMLEKLGYRVESTPDPHAALQMFTAAPTRFSLVITDYAMPGLDGVELSERLWKIREKMPVILYSGYGGQFTSDDAARLGFALMLEKPFQPRTLAEAVAAALRKGKG